VGLTALFATIIISIMPREMSMPRCPRLSTRLPVLEDEVYRELAEVLYSSQAFVLRPEIFLPP